MMNVRFVDGHGGRWCYDCDGVNWSSVVLAHTQHIFSL